MLDSTPTLSCACHFTFQRPPIGTTWLIHNFENWLCFSSFAVCCPRLHQIASLHPFTVAVVVPLILIANLDPHVHSPCRHLPPCHIRGPHHHLIYTTRACHRS